MTIVQGRASEPIAGSGPVVDASIMMNKPPDPDTPPPAYWPLLCVHHATAQYAVIDKPPYMLSVPGRGEHKRDSVQSRVAEVFPYASGSITVHRLDWETSGLLVLGLTPQAHRSLSRQFMNRKVGKTYLAILDGLVQRERGSVDLPLIVDWPNRPRQKVDHEEGRPARTLFKVLARDTQRQRTLVEFRPMTGRTHQLRVHAATPLDQGGMGAPILGDSLYGDADKAPRLMLHANMLAFWEPGTGDWVCYQSDPPFALDA